MHRAEPPNLVPRMIRRRRAMLAILATGVTAALAIRVGVLFAEPSSPPLLVSLTPSAGVSVADDGAPVGPETGPGHPDRPAAIDEAPRDPRQDPWVAPARWFDHRPVRVRRTITMTVTAYSPDARSCGASADGVTASGYSVWTNGMRLVAADAALLRFGSLVSVPGYHDGEVVPVLDRGGRIKGRRLDVLFPTHEAALEWGVREIPVTVWEYAD